MDTLVDNDEFILFDTDNHYYDSEPEEEIGDRSICYDSDEDYDSDYDSTNNINL